jgi:putative membrane protein
MIKYNPQSWRLLFVFKGALLKKLFGGMVLITAITVVLCLLSIKYNIIDIKMSALLPGYMGAALGLLLVFRNNSAYDKWWEARKEVGSLVNNVRSMAITVNGMLPQGSNEKEEIGHLLIAFAYALKEHLREGVKMHELQNLSSEHFAVIGKADHKPNMIANVLMSVVEGLYKKASITDMQQYMLADKISSLIDILGRCERIRNTPIPMAYAFLLKFFIFMYVIVLPFGLHNELGWWSVPLVIILYYIMMSIVLTAEEIEEPFGKDINDLSMDEIAVRIRDNVLEIVHQE